jgi:hypothetical protein
MKTKTALSSIVLSLTSLSAFADCKIDVARVQQCQQQQTQLQRYAPPPEGCFAIEETLSFPGANLDQCLDLYYARMDQLQKDASTANMRKMFLKADHRGANLSAKHDLVYGQAVPSYRQYQQQELQQLMQQGVQQQQPQHQIDCQ